MPTSYNLTVGTPDTTPDAPAHTPGVRQGNSPPRPDPGFKKTGRGLKGTARRSTGISPREPRSDHARRAQPLTGVTRGLTRLA